MENYRHILVAIDWSPGHAHLVARASDLATRYQAEVSLIHVVETAPLDIGGEMLLPQELDLDAELVKRARKQLARLIDEHRLEADTGLHIEVGATKHEILRVAEEIGADLIVIGSHGRHGIGRLLGSTANAVLHGAPCDVLAMRIEEESAQPD